MTYKKTIVNKDGYFKESWLSPESHERQIKSIKDHGKRIAINKYKDKAGLINKYKLERGCSLCGYNECSAALDFDHLDTESKKFNISKVLSSKSLEAIFDEIGKCRILCANCHRKHSYENKHGLNRHRRTN